MGCQTHPCYYLLAIAKVLTILYFVKNIMIFLKKKKTEELVQSTLWTTVFYQANLECVC